MMNILSKTKIYKLLRQTPSALLLEMLTTLCLVITIEAFLIGAHIKKSNQQMPLNYPALSPNNVLGVASNQDSPDSIQCRIDQCGFCTSCGGVKDNNCGQLTRCSQNKQGETACKLDLSCIYLKGR